MGRGGARWGGCPRAHRSTARPPCLDAPRAQRTPRLHRYSRQIFAVMVHINLFFQYLMVSAAITVCLLPWLICRVRKFAELARNVHTGSPSSHKPPNAIDVISDPHTCCVFPGYRHASMDPALEPYMSRREFDDAFAELSRQLHKELDGCGDFPISLVFWLIMIVTFVCGGFILFLVAVISARTVAMGIHGRVIGPLCEKAGLTYMVIPAKPPDGYGGGGTLGIVRFFLPAGAPVAGAPTVGDGIHLQTAAEAMERVVTTIVKGDGGLLGITLTRTPAAGARGQHGAGRKIEVTSISAGSPTEAAGLHVGDVLVEIEGRPAPQTAQECIERLQAARAQCTVTVERQRSTNPAMPVAVAVPIPATVAAVPVAGSTMTLPDKVARIKRALDLDEALSLPAAIKAANEMMNLPDTGGLLAQAGALMAALRLEG